MAWEAQVVVVRLRKGGREENRVVGDGNSRVVSWW